MTARSPSPRRHRSSAFSRASLPEALPQLLVERDLSMRALGRLVGVSQSHISRVLSGEVPRTTGELAGDIAVALDLPRDYFPEYRELVAIDAVRQDPALRDRIYRQ